MLALMNPTQTKDSVLVHAGFARESATLICPLFQMAMAAAMVKRVWIRVPRASHARDLQPILSPMRAMLAPSMNVMREQRACWSARWKE